jgi:YggT family protein
MTYLLQAMMFLIDIIVDLYVFILLLRIFLQLGQADFYNPMCQFVAKVTQPILRPLQRIIPNIQCIDLAAIIFAIVLISAKTALFWSLAQHPIHNPLGIILYASGNFLQQALDLLFYAILIEIILSWINPSSMHPLRQLLRILTAPLLNPIRAGMNRLLQGFSSSGGIMQIDIAPIPAMIIIKLAQILLVTPLLQQGLLLTLQ